MIREVIVVEGKDDEAAVKRSVDAQVLITHGFGISGKTWKMIEEAYHRCGIIILTDPDFQVQRTIIGGDTVYQKME